MILPTLASQRLILRPFVLADAADVQLLAGDFAVADTTQSIPHPYLANMAEAWIACHEAGFAQMREMALAVSLRDSGVLIGAISLLDIKPKHRAELGYWIGKPFWGKGYGTEAAACIRDYAWHELDLIRLFARHLTRNPASGRIMQKIGLQHEGSFAKHACKWGVFENVEYYGLIRPDKG